MTRAIKQLCTGALLVFLLLLPSLVAAATKLKPNSRPALWRVEDHDSTVYLFGTITVLCPGETWFDGRIKDAFHASSELVVEVDTNVDQKKILAWGLNPAQRKLSAMIDPKLNARLRSTLENHGLPPEAFEPLKPWMAALSLSGVAAGKTCYSTEHGVETQLIGSAKNQKKAVSFLGAAEDQLRIFAHLTEPQQIELLSFYLGNLDQMKTEYDAQTQLWRMGKTDAILASFEKMFSAMPWLYRPLLTDQNRKWAASIDEKLAGQGTIFVAVTAGHFSGPDSVIELLEDKGHRIERIQ
jgi:uncharacterized protein